MYKGSKIQIVRQELMWTSLIFDFLKFRIPAWRQTGICLLTFVI